MAILIVCFWLAAVLEHSVTQRFLAEGGRPDLLLALALSVSVMFQPRYAALLGFLAGLLQGGMASADLAHFTIAYTMVGFAAGWVSKLKLDVRPWFVALVVLGGTLVAGLLMMIPAPPPEFWPRLRDTILSAMYNGVLAIPIYVLIRRSLVQKVN
ncbi:MAG: hypothetical protein IIC73_05460 [Armatimonadetes bacterium]|nr:hypothetical protein [Armatimonadota bacterium]